MEDTKNLPEIDTTSSQAKEAAPATPTPPAAQSNAPAKKPGGGRGGYGAFGGRGGPRGGGGGRGGPGGGGGRGGDRRREPSEYEEEVLQIARVTRVVKGGRRMRFRATVIVGNKNGKVGMGIGKSSEVTGAIQKAIRQAKKEMFIVPIKNGSIPHEIYIKFKSAKVLMMPAGPGTGIIAGGAVRKIAELAGIKNMLSKMFGGRNRITNAYATMRALKKLKI